MNGGSGAPADYCWSTPVKVLPGLTPPPLIKFGELSEPPTIPFALTVPVKINWKSPPPTYKLRFPALSTWPERHWLIVSGVCGGVVGTSVTEQLATCDAPPLGGASV